MAPAGLTQRDAVLFCSNKWNHPIEPIVIQHVSRPEADIGKTEDLWKLKVQHVKCHPASRGQILHFISPRVAQCFYWEMTRNKDQRIIMSFMSLPAVALFAAQHLLSEYIYIYICIAFTHQWIQVHMALPDRQIGLFLFKCSLHLSSFHWVLFPPSGWWEHAERLVGWCATLSSIVLPGCCSRKLHLAAGPQSRWGQTPPALVL